MTNTPQQQPPGWYYAEGDPPGTQRYWDGAQWQGDPQTVGDTAGAAGGGANGTGELAENGQRIIAWLIDVAVFIGIAIVMSILGVILGAISDVLGTLFSLFGFVVYFGYWIYNFVHLVGTTGQSIGKKQQGIILLNDSGETVGMGMAAARSIFQGVLWTLCFVPGLIDTGMILGADRRRFSDKTLSMQVYKK